MTAEAGVTAGKIAEHVGACCEGDPNRVVTRLASLDDASPDALSFCTGGRWAEALARSRAGAVLLDEGTPPEGVVALRHRDPRLAFARAAALLVPLAWPAPGVHPTAVVAGGARVDGATIDAFAVVERDAVIGEGSWVQAHAYIGPGAVLGRRCRIMPHAVVMDGVRLGDRVRLKPGAVVGADGFGFVVGESGPERFPHVGVAVLEDDVEVGANSCVDRGALGETRVGSGTRLDNLVQVAHNVRIGARSLLAAFAGVAGGARLGEDVVMGGRAAVVDGVSVGDGVVLAALASAAKNQDPGVRLGGSPARPYREWLREIAALRRLPEALRTLDELVRERSARR